MDLVSGLFLVVAIELLGITIIYIVLKKKIDRISDSKVLVGKVKEEINQIVVELNQTTDRNIALIEDKLNGISELLSKADKRISLLKRETEKHEMSKNLYNNIVDSRKKDEDINRQGEVLRLHREGASPASIANHIGMPIGEVELIIALATRKG